MTRSKNSRNIDESQDYGNISTENKNSDFFVNKSNTKSQVTLASDDSEGYNVLN